MITPMNKIVPVPFAHDDLAGLFTGSHASDIENPARDAGKHRRK
jgi:hypothetical protein